MWIAILLTALGMAMTTPDPACGRFAGVVNRSYMQAGAFLIFAFGALCVLTMLDHPHDRDSALADACEDAAGRCDDMKRGFVLPHAFFTAGLVLLSAICVLFFFNGTRVTAQVPEGILIACVAGPVLMAALFAIATECASIGYISPWAKHIVGFLAMAIIYFSMLVPVVHCGVAYGRMQTALRVYIMMQTQKPATNQNQWQRNWNNNIAESPEYQQYLVGITNVGDAQSRVNEYQNAPVLLFWRYHPQASVIYGLTAIMLVAALFAWRKRVYAGLMREARAAVGPAEGPVLIPDKTPQPEPAVAASTTP